MGNGHKNLVRLKRPFTVYCRPLVLIVIFCLEIDMQQDCSFIFVLNKGDCYTLVTLLV